MMTIGDREGLIFLSYPHTHESRTEKSVPRITDWHHEACQVLTIGDREGQIFLSYPYTNKDPFSCSPLFFMFLNKLPEVPQYAKMQLHMMTSLKHNNDVT